MSLLPSVLVLVPAIKAFLFLFWLTLFGCFCHPVRINLCIFVHACWSALHVGVNCRLDFFLLALVSFACVLHRLRRLVVAWRFQRHTTGLGNSLLRGRYCGIPPVKATCCCMAIIVYSAGEGDLLLRHCLAHTAGQGKMLLLHDCFLLIYHW